MTLTNLESFVPKPFTASLIRVAKYPGGSNNPPTTVCNNFLISPENSLSIAFNNPFPLN